MTTLFRNAAGVDFDSLFDPYVEGTKAANCGLRTSNGVDLSQRYAPIAYGTKGPNVNFRTPGGVDVSNLWAAAGTASYGLPFNGQAYGAIGSVVDIQSPVPGTADLTLWMYANGTWEIKRRTNNAAGSSYNMATLASGTWLTEGTAGANSVQFAHTVTSSSGTYSATKSHTGYAALSADRYFFLGVVGNSARSATASLTVSLQRPSGVVSVSTTTFSVQIVQ